MKLVSSFVLCAVLSVPIMGQYLPSVGSPPLRFKNHVTRIEITSPPFVLYNPKPVIKIQPVIKSTTVEDKPVLIQSKDFLPFFAPANSTVKPKTD